MISPDHVIKASCDVMGKSSSRQVSILPNLVAIDAGNRDKVFLVSHVVSQDHVTKGPYDFIDGSP